jgi:hypothetical protein
MPEWLVKRLLERDMRQRGFDAGVPVIGATHTVSNPRYEARRATQFIANGT